MAEFTKGLWTVHRNGRIVLAGGIKIYQSSGPGGQSVAVQNRHDETLKANARLIAAAPELYEACMAMAKAWNEYGFGSHKQFEEMEESAHRAVLAINKADGKPEVANERRQDASGV